MHLKTLFAKGSILFLLCISGCEEMNKKVNMDNVEEFKARIRKDLPVGTKRETIEEYLTRSKLTHTYSPKRLPLEEKNKFLVRVHRVGRYRLIYMTSLSIDIILDDDERLAEITFDFFHEGL